MRDCEKCVRPVKMILSLDTIDILGWVIFVLGGSVLYTVGYLRASLASTH